jgi:thiol-disulfide isomerase/thioredoxin
MHKLGKIAWFHVVKQPPCLRPQGIIMKFVVFLIGLLLVSPLTVAGTPGEVKEGGLLRDGVLYDFAGSYSRLSEWKGKPLIINVWASWCGPCRAEMGSLDRLAVNHGTGVFNVIGISTDDYSNKAMDFLWKSGARFPNYIDRKLAWENMLGADHIPLTVLVNAEGRVLKKVYGSKQWDSVEALKFVGDTFNIKLK